MTMMRCITLLLLVATFAFGHHGDSDDHDHDHHSHGAEVITIAFVNNEWLIEFHAPAGEDFLSVRFDVNDGAHTVIDTVGESHGNHFRWGYAFPASNFNLCDEVNLLVEGEFESGNYREEFHGDKTIEVSEDDC